MTASRIAGLVGPVCIDQRSSFLATEQHRVAVAACRSNDDAALRSLLATEVTLVVDTGGAYRIDPTRRQEAGAARVGGAQPGQVAALGLKLSQIRTPPGHTWMVNESEAIEVFSAVRPRLFGVAYRMLGSVADAEDMVQNVWLRWQTYDRSKVNDPTAFLMTIATRLCINELQSARVRRETYVGPWLPDPVDTSSDATLGAERVEALEFATLLVMEKLLPTERAAYVLREAFDYPYAKIAQVIAVSEANARQLVNRARKHLASDRRVPVDVARQRDLLAAFLDAAINGEMSGLEQLFVDDVISYTDGNGARNAARFPVVGKATVAKFILVFRERVFSSARFAWVTANNQPAVIVSHPDGSFETFIALTVTSAGISQVLWHRLEDKVKHLQ